MGTKKNNTGVFPLCWCHSRIPFVLQFNLPLWDKKTHCGGNEETSL